MSEKFDWYGTTEDGSSVVVPSQSAIAVYINVNGDIVIRQQDTDSREDRIIVIHPDYVTKLADSLHARLLELEELERLDREAEEQEAEQ